MGYLFEIFWIIICLVAGHIVTMWLLFYFRNRSKGSMRNALLNSFSNIYLQILIEEQTRQYVTVSSKPSHHFLRLKIIVNAIHIFENTIMLMALLLYFKENVTISYVAGSAYAATIVGLVLKMIYYKFFHIWQDIEKYPNKTQKTNQPPQMTVEKIQSQEESNEAIEPTNEEDLNEATEMTNMVNKVEIQAFHPKQSKTLESLEPQKASEETNYHLVAPVLIHCDSNVKEKVSHFNSLAKAQSS
jgi:hypothetical protein